jgi:hypothetical protein
MSELKANPTYEDEIIIYQLAELNGSKLFQNDKKKYLGEPITEEQLNNYEESTSWMRANVFVNEERILGKAGVGFIGTGGGGSLFDYLFRDKSSRALIFADMPYFQAAYYKQYINEFRDAGIVMIDDKFYKVSNNQPVSAASEHISSILANASFNKLSVILNDECAFDKYIGLSLAVDFGSENDKPARLFISCRTQVNIKTFGYIFGEKDSREKMNNSIVICLLNILANEINNPGHIYDSVEIERFPKRSSELKEERNKSFFDKLYLLTNM